ncbi:uncharacterized protein BROUX77_004111 [Berkeleyomyces rouxiae]|uniref:uncharacterized protein n=1 Tax=Berkeleyomyces rouxiae TaxID=2035830 RepID=UPI003B7FBF09
MAYIATPLIIARTMSLTDRAFFRPAQHRAGWGPDDIATSSASGSTNSSPVVGLDLNFDVGALSGADESQWHGDALQGFDFSGTGDLLNMTFSDYSGNLDAFAHESPVLNDLAVTSMNHFTPPDFHFSSLSATAPISTTSTISMNNISFAQPQVALAPNNISASVPSSSVSPASTDSPPTGPVSLERSSTSTSRTGSGTKRSRTSANPDEEDDEDTAATVRRQKNTLAARKYRQKRLDRIKELEDALAEVTGERDDLRIRLARQEAETKALKALMTQLAPAASKITIAPALPTSNED